MCRFSERGLRRLRQRENIALFEFSPARKPFYRIICQTRFICVVADIKLFRFEGTKYAAAKEVTVKFIEKLEVQNILVQKYGFSADTASCITQNFLKSFRKCPERGDMSLHDWRHMLWKKSLGESHLEISGEIYCQWLNLRYKYIAPSPEVISLLETLGKSYCLALITNGPSNSQWEKIKRLRLNQYFDLILVSGDLEWEKPNKNIFLEACDHLGVSPEECIMVGDKLETDILGGIESGLGGTVWVPLLGNNFSEENPDIVPDHVMNDVAELKFILSSRITSSEFQSNRIRSFPKRNDVDVDDGNSNGSDGS